jgi:hypothetical protein
VYNTCLSNIGGDIGALPVLRKIVDNGHKLMLWTMRGTVLTSAKRNTLEALKWFSDNEILYGVLMRTHYKRNWLV